MTIHFGTDGWRGVISDTFTFHNLRLVTQAIADAVAAEEWLNGAGAVSHAESLHNGEQAQASERCEQSQEGRVSHVPNPDPLH